MLSVCLDSEWLKMDPDRDPHVLESRYANYFGVGFNRHEVVIECGQFYAGDEKPLIHTRLVTTPVYAANLLELLRETLQQYQFQFDEHRTD